VYRVFWSSSAVIIVFVVVTILKNQFRGDTSTHYGFKTLVLGFLCVLMFLFNCLLFWYVMSMWP